MKKIIYLTLTIILFSCTPAGTVQNLTHSNDSNIEVYKYYYNDDKYVFVSRFKDEPNVVTTTWTEQHGKTSVNRANIVIYENDSIQIIKKL